MRPARSTVHTAVHQFVLVAAFVDAAMGGLQAADPPGAFALLQRVREAVVLAERYADTARIEVVPDADSGNVERYTTDLWAARDGRFELVVTPEATGEQGRFVVGRRAGAAYRIEPGSDQPQPLPSLDTALATLFGEGGADAVAVPALLAFGPRSLPDPEVLAWEGEEPCAETSCFVLSGSRAGGEIAFSIWAEVATARPRRIEVEVEDLLGRRSWRVTIEPRDDRLARIPARLAEERAQEELPTETFSGRIDVELVTVELRAIDLAGGPLLGLEPGDFRVRAGRAELPAASLDWFDARAPLGEELAWEELAEAGITLPVPGRLIVFFVQTDLEASRVGGQMRILPKAQELVASLGPDDLAAVVSFDSQLRLRQDLTDDPERIREALERAIRPGPAAGLRSRRGPSLFEFIDPRQARDAARAEKGLALVGRALESLEREKVVVYLGWGLGTLSPGGVHLPREYGEAVAALARARASVFVLDITEADYHSLEVGLQQIAGDTGGTYAKTYSFGALAVDRLAQAITGHYLLTVEIPPALAGEPLRIELSDRRRGSVLLRHAPAGVRVEVR